MRVHAAFLIACATAMLSLLLPPHFPSFVSNFEMCRRGGNKLQLCIGYVSRTYTQLAFGTISLLWVGENYFDFASCALKLLKNFKFIQHKFKVILITYFAYMCDVTMID